MTERIRRTPEQWQEIIDDQLSSGLSARRYCESRHLCYPVLCKWRKRLTADPTAAFVDVSGLVTAERRWDIELVLDDGMALRLRRA